MNDRGDEIAARRELADALRHRGEGRVANRRVNNAAANARRVAAGNKRWTPPRHGKGAV